jgi:hypothetical protein
VLILIPSHFFVDGRIDPKLKIIRRRGVRFIRIGRKAQATEFLYFVSKQGLGISIILLFGDVIRHHFSDQSQFCKLLEFGFYCRP